MAKCSSCGRQIGFSLGKRLCRWCVEYEAQKRGDAKDSETQRVMPTPWKQTQAFGGSFNQLFMGINLLVFLAMVGTGSSIMGQAPQQSISWGANFGPLTLGGEPWRLITYMFLHHGIIHFGLNMWCLWNIGPLAESLYDDWLFAIVYILSGIGGGIASVAWHPGVPSVGASGAIFGIAGALVASLKLGDFNLPRAMIHGTYRSLVAFCGYNLVIGAFIGGTDNACHIGGLITGLILGALIALVAPGREQIFRRFAICAVVVAILFGSIRWVMNSRGYVVMAQRGAELLAQGKSDEALSYLQRAAQMKPDSVPVRRALAFAYLSKSQYDKAAEEFRRVIELGSKDEFDWYRLGSLYVEARRYPEAREAYSKMLSINPKSAYAHVGLATVATAENKPDVALEELNKAVALNPEIGVDYGRGAALAKLKRYDEAIAAYKQHADLNGEDYQTELALSEAYRAKGMTREADAALAKAQQLKSGNSDQ
jgi:membrane associated rhomboid family serine protease/Flp pilus assembly protein TadD